MKTSAGPGGGPLFNMAAWEKQIRERAYALWRQKGKCHHHAWKAWQQAELELSAMRKRPNRFQVNAN